MTRYKNIIKVMERNLMGNKSMNYVTVYNEILKSIEREMTKSYSHAPHLANLPGDLNSYDPETLQERYDEVKRRINTLILKDSWKLELLPKYVEMDKQIHDETVTLRKNITKWLDPIQKDLDKITDLEEWYDKEWEDDPSYQSKQSLFNDIKEMRETVQALRKNLEILDNANPTSDNDFYEHWNTQSRYAYLLKQTMAQMEFLQRLNVGRGYDGEIWEGVPRGSVHHQITSEDTELGDKLKAEISERSGEYKHQTKKLQNDYKALRLQKANELRDYKYHNERIERYCKDNGIPLKKVGKV